MSYQLFLDDTRDPLDVTWVVMPLGPWEIVRNYKDFVAIIEARGLPTFIAFDHDLSDEHTCDYILNVRHSQVINYEKYQEKTGMSCAKWLVDYCLDKNAKLPNYVVHSMNNVGVVNITSLLKGFKKFQESQ